MNRSVVLALAASLAIVGCKDNKDEPRSQGTPPPPPPSASAHLAQCAGGGGHVSDAISAPFFPQKIADYCLAPQGDEKTYGETAKLEMSQLCETALDGGCEEYKKFGVTRTVIVHYVADATAGSVEVFLSKFKDDGAYAIYTTRLTGEIDPLDEHAARPLAPVSALPGASGAMGTGKAYAQRGPYFLELTYNNDQETPEQLKKSADAILAPMAKEIAAKLPAEPDMPAAAKALPVAERLPNGIQYYQRDVLGVVNAGPGAVGYYKEVGAKRYRVVAAAPKSADGAKDVLHAFRAKPGALPVPNVGDEAVLVVLQPTPERAKIEWLVARKGDKVLGVGDEEFSVPERLSKDEKIAKLKSLLQ